MILQHFEREEEHADVDHESFDVHGNNLHSDDQQNSNICAAVVVIRR